MGDPSVEHCATGMFTRCSRDMRRCREGLMACRPEHTSPGGKIQGLVRGSSRYGVRKSRENGLGCEMGEVFVAAVAA